MADQRIPLADREKIGAIWPITRREWRDWPEHQKTEREGPKYVWEQDHKDGGPRYPVDFVPEGSIRRKP